MAVIPFPVKPRVSRPKVSRSNQTAAAEAAAASVAVPHHPIVTLTWVVVATALAAGLGPWISKAAGVFLPAFALVRLGPKDRSH